MTQARAVLCSVLIAAIAGCGTLGYHTKPEVTLGYSDGDGHWSNPDIGGRTWDTDEQTYFLAVTFVPEQGQAEQARFFRSAAPMADAFHAGVMGQALELGGDGDQEEAVEQGIERFLPKPPGQGAGIMEWLGYAIAAAILIWALHKTGMLPKKGKG